MKTIGTSGKVMPTLMRAPARNLAEYDARIVDLDAGITNRAKGDGEGDALHQREVDMDVEPLRLRRGETVRDDHELLPHGAEVV
jgi:hypothetical protein